MIFSNKEERVCLKLKKRSTSSDDKENAARSEDEIVLETSEGHR